MFGFTKDDERLDGKVAADSPSNRFVQQFRNELNRHSGSW